LIVGCLVRRSFRNPSTTADPLEAPTIKRRAPAIEFNAETTPMGAANLRLYDLDRDEPDLRTRLRLRGVETEFRARGFTMQL